MSEIVSEMVQDNTFFEGVEKLLEVWFSGTDEMTSNSDVRKIPRSQLEMLMRSVKCEIISSTSSQDLDAYVLSESSMFISRRRFILKTCGTTTPLVCLPLLVSLVQEFTGFDTVQDLFYSRRNFKRPELQTTPHRNFEEEAAILDRFFSGKGGRSYCMGSMNGEDRWYLYVVSPGKPKMDVISGQSLANNRVLKGCDEPDETLEVLMTDVHPKKMAYFYKENYSSARDATKLSGIEDLIPGMIIDDFQFDPCGYSMNGVSKTVSGGYMTIHVTPEPEFSYVSFETNVPHKNYKAIINKVVEMFDPKQFVVTFFSSKTASEFPQGIIDERFGIGISEGGEYHMEDAHICRLQGYDLTYALYNRFPS